MGYLMCYPVTIWTPGWIYAIGDSKSASYHREWVDALDAYADALTGKAWTGIPAGAGSTQLYQWATAWAANKGSVTEQPGDAIRVLCNYGANDAVYWNMNDGETWRGHYADLIAAVLAEWPSANIYIAKSWIRNYDANCNTLAGWVDTVIATAQAAGKAVYAGHDERVWMKGVDNGVTMTDDGIHYSTAGMTEITNQWALLLFP